MKKLIFIWIILISITSSFAQNDSLVIEKSKDKVIIGGQHYYVHIVKKGETLWSLCKVYDVTQKQIAKENPEIFLGLKPGQALKIPVVDEKPKTGQKDDKYVLYHRVKPGQTLYSLSQMYNVSKEDIIAFNDPSVEYVIKVNQIIRIPKNRKTEEVVDLTPKSDLAEDTVRMSGDFIYHKLEAGETEWSLLNEYDITKEILLEHNPFLKDGFKFGQVIKIPKVEEGLELSSLLLKDAEQEVDSLYYIGRKTIPYSDSIKSENCRKLWRPQREPYEVSLLLPFYLDKNDEEFYVDSSEFNNNGERIYEKVYYDPFYIYPRSMPFVEFYEGLLLAIDSLKEKGLSVNLHVYDTQNDTARIKEILSFPELSYSDLIIGPIYNQEVKLVSEFSKRHGIKMISPLMDNLKLVDDNPNLFQVYPSYNSQIDEFAEFVSNFSDKNIVLVHDGDSLAYSNVEMVKEKIFNNLSEDTLINNIQFKEVVFTDSIFVFEHALSDELENVFIVPSNEEAFVTNVVTKLNTLKAFGKEIRVVGLSRWQGFKNIDPEYYFNLDLCIASPFFIDYHEEDVKNFVLKYRKTYHTEPDQMAIHAYDVGLYFMTALMNYGENFEQCIYNHRVDLLQADYRFVKWYVNSGYENVNVDIIKYYEGYHIFKINDSLKLNSSYSQKSE